MQVVREMERAIAPPSRSADRLTEDFLRCQFSDAEMLELGKQMARAANQKRELESRKAEVTKRLGAEIAEKDTELGKLTERVSQGYEYRNIECGIWFDCPRPGVATTFRLDTMEPISERRMSDSELQSALDFAGGPAEEQVVSEENSESIDAADDDLRDSGNGDEKIPNGDPVRRFDFSKRGASAALDIYADEDLGGYTFDAAFGPAGVEGDEISGHVEDGSIIEQAIVRACTEISAACRRRCDQASSSKDKSAYSLILTWANGVAAEARLAGRLAAEKGAAAEKGSAA